MDTLDAATFAAISRRGALSEVLAGVEAADRAGLKVKINAVAQKGLTEDSAMSLVRWAHGRGYDLTFIEVMPLGDVEREWPQRFLSLAELRARLAERLTLTPTAYRSSGPARYWQVEETGGRIGFITPMTHSFCDSCNRVRVACSGRMYLCLGAEGRGGPGRRPTRQRRRPGLSRTRSCGRCAQDRKATRSDRAGPRTPTASSRPISLTGG